MPEAPRFDPPWAAVTAAFDADLRVWEAYAVEVRAWVEVLRADVEAGRPLSAEHVRVGGEADPARLLEQADWLAETVERWTAGFRDRLGCGDIRTALTSALMSGPGARGFDYRAPGFFREPAEAGDLRPTWEVSDRAQQEVLRAAFLPDAPPAWHLRSVQGWARPLVRLLWSDTTALRVTVEAYEAHLAEVGNPWGEAG
ncbi:MAG: hypothetical protein CMM84_10475 [Rhodothermaceae bacterium]|nr:hypothetical protein [Rhodothermaceae bacterium]MBC14704.1 hypothetical protein [Rhodothermaceae bacterium]